MYENNTKSFNSFNRRVQNIMLLNKSSIIFNYLEVFLLDLKNTEKLNVVFKSKLDFFINKNRAYK